MRATALGARLIDLVGPQIQSATMPPLQGRTFYVVFRLLRSDLNYRQIAGLQAPSGATADGRISIQTGGSDQGRLGARFDTLNGTSNASVYVEGTATVGNHIVWASVNDGMTAGRIGVDTPVEGGSRVLSPAGGMPYAITDLRPSDWGVTSIAALAYPEEHDERKRALVMDYLNRSLSLSLSLSRQTCRQADFRLAA